MTMPGLVHRSPQLPNQSSGSIADCQGGFIPSLYKDGADHSQLRRFWNELSTAARRDLLRIDKHSLFEQVRKNLYCSRCNGLLLEAFSQLVTYSKSHQGGSFCTGKLAGGCNKAHCDRRGCSPSFHSQDDVRDPSVHPWGGLTAVRDSTLTLLDCFLDGQALEVIQNVCDCARARERERELLYPDACGGGGRGWITQGVGSFGSGRGHSLKETCALHTARLSCDALVDFWSALGEETRRSLLRMKEEDFIARLMFRFESKRFCRDCRRNVLKELKELKELKRSRKEPKCTRWFCNADTAFRYEVSNTSVHVNWKECVGGDFGSMYQHFEWALGSAEGNSDILGFEDVGLSEGARVDGLDLSQISLFFITLRAWKHDGRCTEVSVKAHGLKGKQCVHRRLLVGDGYVMITKGDSIKRFFEHAEEAEEEEDDDGMDKSGSEPENEGFRVQKHAKSPELAREFLLDAATIIFKEQVEKAFREGTARQNAHTIFVCLALNLLEERIHVAYKEISTLEKQKQLLEEEEHERREEEQRRERKRLKEKEKKLRRKEKQKGREREKEKFKCDLQPACNTPTDCDSGATSLLDENEEVRTDDETKESRSMVGDGMLNDELEALQSSSLESMEVPDCSHFRHESLDHFDLSMSVDNFDHLSTVDSNSSFFLERSKASRRRSRPRKGQFMEVISRRFIRRSSVTSLDSTDSSQGRMKLSCTSVRETSEVVTEQVFLSRQKVHRGFIKPERNTGSNSSEGWNSVRYQQRQNGLVSQSSSKRTYYVKTRQNDTSWSGKECLSMKSSQRKNSVVGGSQKVTQMGSFVSGSSQCNWKIMKSIPAAGRGKRGLPDQDALADSEVISSNSSSESEKAIEPDCKEGKSVGAEPAEPFVSSDQHAACDCISPSSSSAYFAGEQQHTIISSSADACQPESLVFLSDSPAVAVEALSNVKPLGRVVAVSTGEALDDDASPSSAISCVTDTSDGGGTSCSMRTESSKLGSSCSSIEASNAELLPSVSAEHQACIRASMQHGVGNESLKKDHRLAPKHENPRAVSGIERLTGPEYYPYSSADSTVQLPLLPSSLMPMHVPQSFGFPWMPGQCVAQPVLSAGLLPLPAHPGNLYVDGFGPSTGGMTAALLPLPPPFQPVPPPVMGFTCIPAHSMNQSFPQWSEQQLVYDDRQGAEILPIRNAFEEYGLLRDCMTEEPSSGFSDFPDAAPATNDSSNDPLGFSLFHFGSLSTDEQELTILAKSEEHMKEAFKPLDMSCGRAVQQEAAGAPKSSLPVEEYSLFAATPSSRFGFF
ncbi:hypothetical protein GOP47_0000917 [Adiantum capillus-veneris]|uniref:Stress response protein nst1 n=1 Tax=Adiantum capillus-veneris TaxID=13818 RepID=A0A9D4VEF3_ADICA|nr:hypothetical protein GOP47_0000917 [Adiantum capillus-veneris]